MLTEKQVKEIHEHLEKAQNPIFFFDNDPDGLCSFLLLQRYIERGKGVAIKSFPSLDASYCRKVEELNADYVFILDKPVVSEEFFKKLEEVNIPIIWIDHHEIDAVVPGFVNYYNPAKDGNGAEPVTALCYQITKKKEDMWIAVLGCISDSYLPDFYYELAEKYPDLTIKTNNAFDVLYKSKIGSISRLFSDGLKDKTSNVVNMLRYLIKVKSPYEVLEENPKNRSFHKRSEHIHGKYQLLLGKAKNLYKEKNKVLFFKYSGDLSISGELSNELSYNFPEKIIAVAYVKGGRVNLSLRGKGIKEKFLRFIEGLDGASGGGHKDAVGGVIKADNLNDFRKKLEEDAKNR